ncbi:uncharacterized protein [Rutidosis leptorrhynchoides]|uniref:uncharacterized protein n=1 Tax=Rutidosis leptorrhynchoides TaxID=125765 RepID=UPI003A9923B0
MTPFEALYGRACRTPVYWDEVGERKIIGPELIQQSMNAVAMIRGRLKTSQSRHKSYADKRRRSLEFQVGDHVFLKVSPMREISRFGKKGKLSLRKYEPDPTHVFSFKELDTDDCVSYVESPVQIVDSKEQVLHTKTIPLVKVVYRRSDMGD